MAPRNANPAFRFPEREDSSRSSSSSQVFKRLLFPQHSRGAPRKVASDARAICDATQPLIFEFHPQLYPSPLLHLLLFLPPPSYFYRHEAKLGRRRNFYFSFSIEFPSKGRRTVCKHCLLIRFMSKQFCLRRV